MKEEGAPMSGLAEKLKTEFKNRAHRHAFVNEFLDAAIAAQIKALREQRKWTQADLANRAGMKQSRISLMENVNYSSWSVNTLRKLARAFDVCLSVGFRSFGKTVLEIELFGPDSLEVASFVDDAIFFGKSADTASVISTTTPSFSPKVQSRSTHGLRGFNDHTAAAVIAADATPSDWVWKREEGVRQMKVEAR